MYQTDVEDSPVVLPCSDSQGHTMSRSRRFPLACSARIGTLHCVRKLLGHSYLAKSFCDISRPADDFCGRGSCDTALWMSETGTGSSASSFIISRGWPARAGSSMSRSGTSTTHDWRQGRPGDSDAFLAQVPGSLST